MKTNLPPRLQHRACGFIYLPNDSACPSVCVFVCVCIYKYVVSKYKLIGGETLECVWQEDFWSNLGHNCEIIFRWL